MTHSATFDFFPHVRHALRATPHGERPLSVAAYEAQTGKAARDWQADPALYTTDAEALVDGADVVIELMGGIEPARTLILRALAAVGYETPSPIQAATTPPLLDGRDVIGQAQTGTGKTAAFALPVLARIEPSKAKPQALVLAPTRELASQIDDSFKVYGRHVNMRSTVIFGGVGQNPQVDALRRGVDVLIATPGRLLDLLQQRRVR